MLPSYFPGGTLNALASPLEGSTLQVASVHCLGRGIQGYLHFCYYCLLQRLRHFCLTLYITAKIGLYHHLAKIEYLDKGSACSLYGAIGNLYIKLGKRYFFTIRYNFLISLFGKYSIHFPLFLLNDVSIPKFFLMS